MSLDKNNNGRVINRVAKSNIQGSRLYSLFTILTIILSMSLVSGIALLQKSAETEEKRSLANMQHVMYMNVTQQQMEEIGADERTEMMVPYKPGTEFRHEGTRIKPVYFEKHESGISTYTLAEGETPENKNEIVVDKKLMSQLGLEAKLGEKVTLKFTDTEKETFTVSGYTDSEYQTGIYTAIFSRDYADTGFALKEIPYTALVRIKQAEEMTVSEFQSKVFDMAADYGIERVNTNINGKFESSLGENASSAVMASVMVLILLVGAIVIYSIFYLSVSGRVQQIGQLMTIGMTQKQVRKMIAREGLMLSAVGIPAGILIGIVFAYFIRSDGFSITNFVKIAALVAIFGLVAVWVSVQKPAKLAASVSPIEAARYLPEAEGKTKTERPHKMLTPWVLAKLETENHRKRKNLVMTSLAIGGILFMVGSVYISSWDKELYSRGDEFKNCEYIVHYNYSPHEDSKFYGNSELQAQGTLSENVKKKIEGIPHIEQVMAEKSTMGVLHLKGNDILLNVYPITDKALAGIPFDTGRDEDLVKLADDELAVIGTDLTEAIFGTEICVGDTLTFKWFDGKENSRNMKIAGILEEDGSAKGLQSGIYLSEELLDRLWSGGNTVSEFKISVRDYKANGAAVEKALTKLIGSYPELKITILREKILEDTVYVEKISVQIYSLAAFVIVFSILNMINTTAGTITTRRKEFAMLESIGMEKKQILKMLHMEGLLTALPNILITLTGGTLAGYAAILIFRKLGATYLDFHFPLPAFAVYSICMILVPMLISTICLKSQNRTALVERIRSVD